VDKNIHTDISISILIPTNMVIGNIPTSTVMNMSIPMVMMICPNTMKRRWTMGMITMVSMDVMTMNTIRGY